MISYAKHEEEFYGVFKLVSGEEVLGKAVLTEDSGETLCFIQILYKQPNFTCKTN